MSNMPVIPEQARMTVFHAGASDWRVWKADEDGCVQWWVVARTEEEARALLATLDIPNEDTEELTLEQVPDQQLFTLTDVDGAIGPEGLLPDGVEVGQSSEGWPTYRAPAGAWAQLAAAEGKPFYLAGTEW